MSHDMFDDDNAKEVESPFSWRPSRRVMVKAASAFAALAATGGAIRSDFFDASAQSNETVARRWYEEQEVGQISVAEASDYRTIPAEFPFYAVGGSWAGSFATAAQIEFQFSSDGTSYSSPIRSRPSEDGGRPSRENRVFVNLVFANGARFIRYRVLDGNGTPVAAPDVQIVYIDGTNGPKINDSFSAAALPTLKQPTIVSRAGWGADENLRFDSYGEVWPPEYRRVEHIIVHHSDTPNYDDGPSRVRQIYYYHAYEQEWGDIGYNYVVDWQGRIYLGRYGGPHVVGGHAFKYAFGSCGICVLGTFNGVEPPAVTQSALIAITAWIGRNLNPTGFSTFHEVANLPTICGHRDVSQSQCPGSNLWADLPSIRNGVKDLLDETASPADDPVPGFPAEIYKTGDNVVTDRANLHLRKAPSEASTSLQSLPSAGTPLAVSGYPRTVDGALWYYVLSTQNEGYIQATYLEPAPAGSAPAATFTLGDRVRTTQYVDIRRDPGVAQRITGGYGQGTTLTITVDSVVMNGVRWWGVYNSQSAGGWVNQAYLVNLNLPKLTVTPVKSSPGASVTLNLTAFPANSSVAIKWDGSTKRSVTTNSSGAASTIYTLPSGVKGGHTFSAVSGSSSATAPFEIAPRFTLNAYSGPVGTVLNVSARGFESDMTFYMRWQTATGWIIDRTQPAKTTSALGTAATTIKVPSRPVGTVLKVRADTRGSIIERTFTITGTSVAEEPERTATPRPTQTAPAEEPTLTPTAAMTVTPSPEPTGTATPSEAGSPEADSTPTATPTRTRERPRRRERSR